MNYFGSKSKMKQSCVEGRQVNWEYQSNYQGLQMVPENMSVMWPPAIGIVVKTEGE